MARSEGLQSLIGAYRLTNDGDAWGSCMKWWFTIADEIYFNRDNLSVPDDWQFRPSPLGPSNEEGDYEADECKAASDEDLMAMGGLMHRLAGILKAKGLDY